MKQNCDAGRQWGFVTFSTPNEAMSAQEQTNGLLTFQNSSRPCEVTLARNQGGGRPPPVDTGPKKATLGLVALKASVTSELTDLRGHLAG